MALTHDGFAFFSGLHTPVVPAGVADLPVRQFTYAGVRGESHLVGEIHGRDLTCQLTVKGYATEALLRADLETLMNKAGVLVGVLAQDIDGNRNFGSCTFLGFSVVRPPRKDASGVNGWIAIVQLRWRERVA